MRLGTTLDTPAQKFASGAPNPRSGIFASVSALRPTMNTPKVNTAVKNGEENAANTVAIAVTTATSDKVSSADPSTTRRSSGAAAANNAPVKSRLSAHGTGRNVRQRGQRNAAPPAAVVIPPASARADSSGRPPSTPSASKSAPESAAMNMASVSTVPRYFPTKYSERRMGRAKIGKIVLS